MLECQGPVSNKVLLNSGLVGRKHVDHIGALGNQSSKRIPPASSSIVSNESTGSNLEVPLPSMEPPVWPNVPSTALHSDPSRQDAYCHSRLLHGFCCPVDRFSFS